MYPDWPESNADLVPLPICDGPKLHPFDFRGPQKIEFLEFLGEGTHARVFKVRILNQIYALKVRCKKLIIYLAEAQFRFSDDSEWFGVGGAISKNFPNDWEEISAFYNYAEPFSCECRAFGRIQENDYDGELAIKCFGYVLLDEEHERALHDRFSSDMDLNWNGALEYEEPDWSTYPGVKNIRGRFPSKSGREPPLRAIVKEFGLSDEDNRLITTASLKKMLKDIIKLQKLGIVHVDTASRQLIGGRFSDFSSAITSPHYAITPELNPSLSPDCLSLMEIDTFKWAAIDYTTFDSMVETWNWENKELEPADQMPHISFRAFPNGLDCTARYNLRNSKQNRYRIFTYVDPRKYNWQADSAGRSRGRVDKGKRRGHCAAKTKKRLTSKPERWYFECDEKMARKLNVRGWSMATNWHYKDGVMFPSPAVW